MSGKVGLIIMQTLHTDFAREYEALREEHEIARKIIRARLAAGLTQKELAQRIGTKQSNMSRIENGNCNPSITTLSRIAKATGKKLQVEFI